MDPRSSAVRSIFVLGSILIILGVGTWALVANPATDFMRPALFGVGFLVIGSVLLKVQDWYRRLLMLSVLVAIGIMALSSGTVWEAVRAGSDAGFSPVAMQQSVAVLLCGGFVFVSLRRLASASTR